MSDILHIINGECAVRTLANTGLEGNILLWRDLLYEGKRISGKPDAAALHTRAVFLSENTAGGICVEHVLRALQNQYATLHECQDNTVVLWFDGCLFDQSMLAHILSCLYDERPERLYLIVEPVHGLGVLDAEQMRILYEKKVPVTEAQFQFALQVEDAFATQDMQKLQAVANATDAPLPCVPAAARRWLKELAGSTEHPGCLKALILHALSHGCHTPTAVFKHAAREDEPPQYWGDTTLWREVNQLADAGKIHITGPASRLPQWGCPDNLDEYILQLPLP